MNDERIKFDCNGRHAPAYGCNKPGDNSGEYVPASAFDAVQADNAVLREALEWCMDSLVSAGRQHVESFYHAKDVLAIEKPGAALLRERDELRAEVGRLNGLVAHLEEQVDSQYDEAVTAKGSEVQR